MRNERKLTIGIVFSLVLHGLLATVLAFSPSLHTPIPHHARQTEVELIDPEKLRAVADLLKEREKDIKGQIVEQDEKAINDERDDEAKFLSRHNQKVLRETKATAFGKFRNTDGSAGEKSQQRQAGKAAPPVEQKQTVENEVQDPAQKQEEKPKQFLSSQDGVPAHAKPTLKDLTPSFKPAPPPTDGDLVAKGGGTGPSANDDHIKDVAVGMQTLLSTREFVYYTYYNRIKDKLRQYWEPKIKEKMEHILRTGRTIASNTERITRIVIILDNTGTLIRVQVVGPSGVSDLDDAAAEAFRAAAPFPHPPKGIIDSDGTIKIRWDFILEA